MAMSANELASTYCYELFNVADHVARCADDAQRRAQEGNAAEALRCLEACRQSADLFEMRYRDAFEAIKKLEGK